MPQAPDLESFKPKSADELLKGIIGQIVAILGGDWKKAQGEIKGDLQLIANAAFQTQSRLAGGKISTYEADQELHFQEVYLNSALSHLAFLTYAAAQDVLDGVFGVIRAAVKNWTGIELNF